MKYEFTEIPLLAEDRERFQQ